MTKSSSNEIKTGHLALRRDWSRKRLASRTKQLPWPSQLLYRIDHYTSLPIAAVAVGFLIVCTLALGAGLGFPTAWITGVEVGTSLVTLVMVIVIQHTQGREQTATQRKLDELLRALPGAENGLMMLEQASDDVLQDVETHQRSSKEEARRLGLNNQPRSSNGRQASSHREARGS